MSIICTDIITKYLSQNVIKRAKPQSKVLIAIQITFTHVVTRKMPLCLVCYSSCHTLVQTGVDFFGLEVGSS